MQTFNVDEYLEQNGVTIRINGKDFVVKDVPSTFQSTIEEKDTKEAIKLLLDCSDKDLEGYGEVAFSAIVNKVTENLFPASFQNKASED